MLGQTRVQMLTCETAIQPTTTCVTDIALARVGMSRRISDAAIDETCNERLGARCGRPRARQE